MRRALVCLFLCAFALPAADAFGQDPFRSSGYAPEPAATQPRRRISVADELIFRRATYRARQRVDRMETQKWTGHSSLRPRVSHGYHATDLNRYVWTPWSGIDPITYAPVYGPGWGY